VFKQTAISGEKNARDSRHPRRYHRRAFYLQTDMENAASPEECLLRMRMLRVRRYDCPLSGIQSLFAQVQTMIAGRLALVFFDFSSHPGIL
jgi:hypothetical protein